MGLTIRVSLEQTRTIGVESPRVSSKKDEGCFGIGKVEVSCQLGGSLLKGNRLKAEFEHGSGINLNGGLKEGLYSGVIFGEPEEYCFVEEIMGGGPSRPQVKIDG